MKFSFGEFYYLDRETGFSSYLLILQSVAMLSGNVWGIHDKEPILSEWKKIERRFNSNQLKNNQERLFFKWEM